MTEKKGAQNSPLRKMFSPLTTWGASTLIKRFPNITADKITDFGYRATIVGSVLKAVPEKILGKDFSLTALGLMVIGLISDGLDGPVSKQQKTPSVGGAVKDVLTDRRQELIMVLSRIANASMRKDPIGVAVAFLAGITGPVPSLIRAKVEALDSVVPEAGNNPFSIFGMRLPRAAFAIAATSYPEVPLFNYPLQWVLDTISTASNISAIIERASILKRARKGELSKRSDHKTQELGKQKVEALSKFNKLNFVTMLAAGTIGLINALQ